MENVLKTGVCFEKELEVLAEHTAVALGSGLMDVLSTPYMIALMEHVAMYAVAPYLSEGCETVGTQIHVNHIKATGVGRKIRVHAELCAQEGRQLEFNVTAWAGDEQIGFGTHQRFIVQRERFMAALL